MTQAIVSLYSGKTPLCLPVNANTTTRHLKQQIYEITLVPVEEQVLRIPSGHALVDQDLRTSDEFMSIQLAGRILGGKGGFGSMLRAQGGRMNAQKTTNFEACRDLQGRRIRTVNDAKKLQEELDAIPEREAEKREKLKKKIEEALKERETKKYLFDDNKFLEDKEDVVESVKSAVGDAIKRQKLTHLPAKKAATASTSASLFDDDISSDEEEDEGEDGDEDEDEVEDEDEEDEEDEEGEGEDVEEEEKLSVKGKGKKRSRK
ncbi:telomere stability and silencing-domain-containing protein [Parasitella parasitica]|nr:telomere stability and silencing-domain-containing protein [Parasitella parasitica]